MIKFLPLGGASEIGASCFYLNINGTGIILDSGMHPQKTGKDALPDFSLIAGEPVDYLLISHAHQDHLSSLPYLVRLHPYIKIITTPQTRALAELTLHNSVSILRQQLTPEDDMQVYSHQEVDLLIKSIDYKNYNTPFEIPGYKSGRSAPVIAEFYDAGHILGSAGILLEFDGLRLFYTGDINLENQAVMVKAVLPKGKVDILILETTYGSTDSKLLNSWNDEAARLASSINKVISRSGSVLIPVFALGKAQEMLASLWRLMLKGTLADAPIYTGGIAAKINRVYDYNRYVVNVKDKELILSDIPQHNFYQIDRFEKLFSTPSIVLAASGMVIPGTASYKLAKLWLQKHNSAIFTVGYMDETTPGYTISNAQKGSKIKLSLYGKEEEVRCDIKKFRFTAHAKREGLLHIADTLKPDTVILVHGEPDSAGWIGSRILRSRPGTKVYLAETGKPILLS